MRRDLVVYKLTCVISFYYYLNFEMLKTIKIRVFSQNVNIMYQEYQYDSLNMSTQFNIDIL